MPRTRHTANHARSAAHLFFAFITGLIPPHQALILAKAMRDAERVAMPALAFCHYAPLLSSCSINGTLLFHH